MAQTIGKISYKDYKCKKCGFVKKIQTNHWGQCYSLGNYNHCPKCAPYEITIWECMEQPPEGFERSEDWKQVKLGDVVEVK